MGTNLIIPPDVYKRQSLEGFWLAPQNIAIALAAAAALSIAGYALGMKMLGKHFKPAGVA